MHQDNIFENSEWRPSGNNGKFDDLIVKDAKRNFSRFSLALFIFLISANAVVTVLTTVMALIMGAVEYEAFVESSPVFVLLASSLPIYLIAFPILYLIVRKMPTRQRVKTKLPALYIFYFFLVAEAFMIVGNLLGQTVTTGISTFLGIEIENTTSEIIFNAPIWLIIILVVIIGPIVEELIFRKLMIDRLSRYCDLVAIIVSAIAFGLFHGNLYQLFYATLLGLLLGYVYTKTGKLIYTVILHSLINFMGSVAAIPIIKYEEILLSGTMPETGAALREQIIATMAIASYSVIQYAMIIPGIIIFINAIKYRLINVPASANDLKIPERKAASAIVFNLGSILFLAFSLITVVASLFLG